MASLSVHVLLHVPSGVASPVSAIELTVKVAAWAGFAVISSPNHKAAITAAPKTRALALPIRIVPTKLVLICLFLS